MVAEMALEAVGKALGKQNGNKMKETEKTQVGGTIGHRPLRGPCPKNNAVQRYYNKCQL